MSIAPPSSTLRGQRRVAAESRQRPETPADTAARSIFVLAQAKRPAPSAPEGYRPLTAATTAALKNPRRRVYLLVGNPERTEILSFAQRLRERKGSQAALFFLDTRDAPGLLYRKRELGLPIALTQLGEGRFRIQTPQVILLHRTFRKAEDPFHLMGMQRQEDAPSAARQNQTAPAAAPTPPPSPTQAIPGVPTLTLLNVEALVVEAQHPVIVIAGTTEGTRTKETAQAALADAGPRKTLVVFLDLSDRATADALLRRLNITLELHSVKGHMAPSIPQCFRYDRGTITKEHSFTRAQRGDRIRLGASNDATPAEETPEGIIELESETDAQELLSGKLPVRLLVGSGSDARYRRARRILRRGTGVGTEYRVAFLDLETSSAGDVLFTLGLSRRISTKEPRTFEYRKGAFRPAHFTRAGKDILGGAPVPAPYRRKRSQQ